MMRGERDRTKNLTAFSTSMIMTLILIKKGGVVLLVSMTQRWQYNTTVLMKEQVQATTKTKTIMMATTELMKREGGVLPTTMMSTIRQLQK